MAQFSYWQLFRVLPYSMPYKPFRFRGFRFDDACWCGEAVSSLSGRNNHCSGNWRKENRACSCHQGRNVHVAVDLTPYNLDWRENNALIGGI